MRFLSQALAFSGYNVSVRAWDLIENEVIEKMVSLWSPLDQFGLQMKIRSREQKAFEGYKWYEIIKKGQVGEEIKAHVAPTNQRWYWDYRVLLLKYWGIQGKYC